VNRAPDLCLGVAVERLGPGRGQGGTRVCAGGAIPINKPNANQVNVSLYQFNEVMCHI
jgi:hypothetical protein